MVALWTLFLNRALSQVTATDNNIDAREQILAAVLPAATLYGVDIANIDPEWFVEK